MNKEDINNLILHCSTTLTRLERYGGYGGRGYQEHRSVLQLINRLETLESFFDDAVESIANIEVGGDCRNKCSYYDWSVGACQGKCEEYFKNEAIEIVKKGVNYEQVSRLATR